jgi:hypothetical protein
MRTLLRALIGLGLLAVAGAIVATMLVLTVLNPDEDQVNRTDFWVIVAFAVSLSALMAYAALALFTGRRWGPATLALAAAALFPSMIVTIAAAIPFLAAIMALALWPLARHDTEARE